MTRRLDRLALHASSRVAVQVSNSYLQWLAVIALARLGVLSGSAAAGAEQLDALQPTAILTDRPDGFEGASVVLVDETWLDRTTSEQLPPIQDRLHDPAAPCRIVLSSGTTGRPRKALLTYGHIRARNRAAAVYGLQPRTRLMATVGISTIGGFTMPLSCWAAGGTVILAAPRPGQPVAHLLHTNPNVLFMSPVQLGNLVDQLPAAFQPLPDLVVYVAGSALPRALSRKARLRLTPSLWVVYGSTEAGAVTLAHAACADGKPGFTGYVLPTAQLEIVNELGERLPSGSVGEVRIRAEGRVDGYLGEEGSPTFREGWFYPGDLGSLGDDGSFHAVGRTAELMNLGGTKVSPGSVEEVLERVPGVLDMAVFSVAKADGLARPCVAVVPSSGFSEQALSAQYRSAFPKLPAIHVVRVAAIPRNEMGKIMRTQLASAVTENGGSTRASSL